MCLKEQVLSPVRCPGENCALRRGLSDRFPRCMDWNGEMEMGEMEMVEMGSSLNDASERARGLLVIR